MKNRQTWLASFLGGKNLHMSSLIV